MGTKKGDVIVWTRNKDHLRWFAVRGETEYFAERRFESLEELCSFIQKFSKNFSAVVIRERRKNRTVLISSTLHFREN
jgi:hypothetical protein